MVEQTKYEKLFSSPFMRFELPDNIALNSEILEECQKLRDASSGLTKSNRGGWHSEGNLFDSDVPCIGQVRDAAHEATLTLTRKVTTKVDPASLHMKLFAWMNVNPSGGYNAPHTHPGAHWSGVYYVSQPESEAGSSGMIEFLDPRSDLPHWRILKANAFRPKRKFRPKAGELILFPSYLVHWVYPNESIEERVTIAFNATFQKPRKS